MDEAFITEVNWPEAQRLLPDPDWHRRSSTLTEYSAQIREYADVPKRYRSLR